MEFQLCRPPPPFRLLPGDLTKFRLRRAVTPEGSQPRRPTALAIEGGDQHADVVDCCRSGEAVARERARVGPEEEGAPHRHIKASGLEALTRQEHTPGLSVEPLIRAVQAKPNVAELITLYAPTVP